MTWHNNYVIFLSRIKKAKNLSMRFLFPRISYRFYRKILLTLLLLFPFFLLLVVPAKAVTYAISGKVTDNISVGIESATVSVKDPATNTTVTSTTTDFFGNYSVTVSSGTYNIEVIPPTGSNLTPAIASSYLISTDTIINFFLVSP